MTIFEISTGLAAILATSIAFRVLWRENFSIPGLAFGGGMLLLAVEAILGCLTWPGSPAEPTIALLQWRLTVMTLLPGVWLLFALTYSRGNYFVFLKSWRIVLAAFLLLPLATVILFHDHLISDGANSPLRLGPAGRALHVFLIVGATTVLMNLERTFRASVGVMRWQLKFMIVGLGTLFLTRVYSSSQSLLYSTINPALDLFQTIALSIASILGFVSLHRAKTFNLDLQPSQTLVYQSLAVLLVGGYLLSVGFLAKAAALLGGSRTFPLQALLLLVALVALTMLLLSDRLRLHVRRFVSRHLRRPVHNFREVWSRFSEKTVGHVDETELCRATVKWIAETLDVLSVTAWLIPHGDGRLTFAASTALTEAAAERLTPDVEKTAQSLQKLREKPDAIDIDDSRESWVAALRDFHPAQFAKGGNRICIPMVAGNHLLGLIMVGDRVGNVPMSIEDLDLLKCIGDEVARDLARIRLSQRVAEAKELQAFQTMATFFVHDLKNTAWT
ncbi:MAG TPA: GAF domain-containing protein, partial [Methylomirabilota bacterium]|nr:GAF domain-containing protein [Methylomirabilota bacterium]